MTEQSEFVKWAIASLDKQVGELSDSSHPMAGVEIFNLLAEKARLQANPQEQWRCHYNPAVHGRGRR